MAASEPIKKQPAFAPFHRAIDDLHRAHEMLHLSMQGLALLSNHPPLHEILAETAPPDQREREARDLEACKRMAASAKTEIEANYPTLHAQSAVALWGTLDALVEDLVVAWIEDESDTITREAFRKLKVRVSEYAALKGHDRARFLLRELKRALNTEFGRGIARFEGLLCAVGLPGTIEAGVGRDLTELAEIRNIIVHRAGVADNAFTDRCPWLNVQVGSKIKLSHDDYVRHYRAVHVYMYNLLDRVRVYYGQQVTGWSVEEWEERGICGSGH